MSNLTPTERALLVIVDEMEPVNTSELLAAPEIEPLLSTPGFTVRGSMVTLARNGYVEGTKHHKNLTRYSLTLAARRALSASQGGGSIAEPRTAPSGGYDGRELRNSCARPGAMDAYALPSIEGGRLVNRRAPTSMGSYANPKRTASWS